MQARRQHKLYAKFSKCELYLRSVTFLGHVVSNQGVEVDPRKTKVVKKWPTPLITTDIPGILGLDGYNRRFVEAFFAIASRMIALTENKAMFEWAETCEKIFQ